MSVRLAVLAVAGVTCAGAMSGAAIAHATPPGNDAPAAAAAFAPYTAANGVPTEQQAIAELAEARADRGVPRCLGPASFARTVWYRIPEAPVAQEITVDASGRTLEPIDLAAFVQPGFVPPPPAPPPPSGPPATSAAEAAQLQAAVPNTCAGLGDGGASDAEEPGSAVTLRVPPNHPVLVQVGRRGTRGTADDERVVLSLFARPLALFAPVPGDVAGSRTPTARPRRSIGVPLANATITGEDPAVPPCPSVGSIWRQLVPGNNAPRRVSVAGAGATTLAVFSGGRPAKSPPLDCVNRSGPGRLEMLVPVRRGRRLWVRVGSDSQTARRATLRVDRGEDTVVVDGGPGGDDPTAGGPGGGLPPACDTARIERARITGADLAGPPNAYNVKRVAVRIVVRGARVCDAELRLYGPRGLVYAQGRAVQLTGRRRVELPRRRRFVRGRYRLEVTGLSRLGDRVEARTTVRGRLR
jgi:N-acetylmuramoyl-L-alanine amidase